MKTEGTFPNVTHSVIPVLCNHCSNAPCVEACPVTPKAMYKTPEGITMHDDGDLHRLPRLPGRVPVQQHDGDGREPERRDLQRAQHQPVRRAEHAAASGPNKTPMIAGCTASAAETAQRAGTRSRR